MLPLYPRGAGVPAHVGVPAPRPRKRFADGSFVKVWLEPEAPIELRELAQRALDKGDPDYIVITPQAADGFTAELVATALQAGYATKISGTFDGMEVACWSVGH